MKIGSNRQVIRDGAGSHYFETIKDLRKSRLSGDFHGKNGPIKVSDPGYVAKGSKLYRGNAKFRLTLQ